jgi:cysteinyl-tRNA synthetase
MYTCGPTVYNFAHIGNFRAYVFEDLLRRALKWAGFRVIQAMNLTDVDDKTIRGARAAGISLEQFTQTYKEAFFQDLRFLNIERAEHYPAATAHVPEMIRLIERLLERGYAYRSDDGSIYFSIAKFPAYGKLARLDLAGLKAGARVAQDEYEKENAADFALWKLWDNDDGDVGWDSPWGRGRPGWHIECSAMSMTYLGASFDLHTGGIDNMFPHHEDEIAQSEAATGRPFVKYWMHCAHLVVDGRKMSKSLGNFYTLRDLRERGYRGREIRYVLCSAQYRQALNFTFEALQAARAALQRLDEFRSRLRELSCTATVPAQPSVALPDWAQAAVQAFRAAIDEDLNTPEALAAIFSLVHEGNIRSDRKQLTPEAAGAIDAALQDCDRVFGLLAGENDSPEAPALALLAQRTRAREEKNWREADRIRDELARAGWIIQDTPAGPKLRKK